MSKLSVLLATTDQLAPSFKKGISDTGKFFKQNQSAFQGLRKTYEALPDTVDIPANRAVTNVVTTVEEKLQWIEESSKSYIDALFSQEATNASGKARTNLYVDGIHFGEFSTLELMRLKGILESAELTNLYEQIPVRSEAKTWKPTDSELYTGRAIYQDALISGVANTTEKENYILQDPNYAAAIAAGKTFSYTPIQATKTTTIKLGEFTVQNFTGEASHRERAETLRRLTLLKTAVLGALKQANDVESIPSDMTAQKLFSYLNTGSL